LGDGGADGSLALQNLVEKAALDAVAAGKCVLASFSLNCCLEQPDNVVVFQHKWGAAHFACAPGMSRFRLFTFWQCKRPGEISRNPGDTVQCGKTSLLRGVSTPCSADRVLSVLPSAPPNRRFHRHRTQFNFSGQCRLPKRVFLAGVRSLSARGNACRWRMIDALLNLAVFAVLVLCIIGF